MSPTGKGAYPYRLGSTSPHTRKRGVSGEEPCIAPHLVRSGTSRAKYINTCGLVLVDQWAPLVPMDSLGRYL